MLDEKGFDNWAREYDSAVAESNEDNTYPFAGYERLLYAVEARIPAGKSLDVLDIGFGTGVLTQRLYHAGHSITGIDFSAEMIRTAQEKMPNARLLHCDFSKGLPSGLSGEQFDRIISTYALHHLTDAQKVYFLTQLLAALKPEGKIVIGDISFPDYTALEYCRQIAGDEWDDDEHYFVYEELKPLLPANTSYEPVSFCSGILEIEKISLS